MLKEEDARGSDRKRSKEEDEDGRRGERRLKRGLRK